MKEIAGYQESEVVYNHKGPVRDRNYLSNLIRRIIN